MLPSLLFEEIVSVFQLHLWNMFRLQRSEITQSSPSKALTATFRGRLSTRRGPPPPAGRADDQAEAAFLVFVLSQERVVSARVLHFHRRSLCFYDLLTHLARGSQV